MLDTLPSLRNLKYELIGTPLERPAMQVRAAVRSLRHLRHPELAEIYREDERVDAVLARVLRPDSNCLDIGCHYGSMLSQIVRLAPLGRHVAFEAIPEKVKFLRRKFPSVRIHEAALAETEGSTTFFVNESKTGFSGLARHGEGTFREIHVRTRKLDDLLAPPSLGDAPDPDALPRIDFVKIDVEGAELFVLRGAKKLLARDRPTVLFECSPSGPPAFGYTPGALFDLFAAADYDVYLPKDFLANTGPITRERFEEALVYPFKAFNWIGVPRVARR